MVQVFDCATALNIWHRLHSLFVAQSTAHIVQTRLQLASLKKGSDSITDYFNKAKGLVSSIKAAGQAIGDDEFLSYILAGLSSDYDSIVTSLSTQPTVLSPDQILFHLLNHESRLSRLSSTSSILGAPPIGVNSTTTNPEVNFTSHRGGRGGYRFNSGGRGSFNNNTGGGGFSADSGRNSTSGGRGRGRGSVFSGEPDNRPICQLCDKRVHTALKCWHRFDQSLQAPPPRSFQANVTTSQWYPDSAATHHYTPDISNLKIDNLPYNGTDQVFLGDGSTVSIRNHGSADTNNPPLGPR